MALNINQFAQSVVQGVLDMLQPVATISAQIDVSSAGGLVAGQPVKIVNSVGGVPKVVECAANSDDVFGFINYDLKTSVFNAYAACEISYFKGNVMYMTSSAAIARNAEVAIVISGVKVVSATTGMMIVGRALDEATAANQLIRVIINLPGALHA